MPVPCASSVTLSSAIVALVSGTKMSPSPTPRRMSGQKVSSGPEASVIRGELPHRDEEQERADGDGHAGVEPVGVLADDRHGRRRRQRARQDDEPRLVRRQPVQALEKDREDEDRAEKRQAEPGGDAHARRELTTLQYAKIDDRLVRRQLAPDEQHEREPRREREPADEPRVEPVVPLALLEHELQRPDAEREEQEAQHVDLAGALLMHRVVHVRHRHDRGENAERDVDVEDPGPVVVVDDPAAERRARASARP